MNNDSEHIHVEFHNKARTIFFAALDDFEHTVKTLNRKTEEYQFSRLKKKYINTLKMQLEDAANVLLKQHQYNRELDELHQSLQQIIKDYLHRFVMKSRTM